MAKRKVKTDTAKSTASKAPAKKSAVKKATAKKSVTKKATAKKTTAAKGPAKKKTEKKSTVAPKSPAKKSAVKKASVTKKSVVKKGSAETSTTKKKASTKRAAKETVVPTATKSKKAPVTKRRKKKVDEEQLMKDVAAELEKEAKSTLKSKRKKKTTKAKGGKDAAAKETAKTRAAKKDEGELDAVAEVDEVLSIDATGAAEKPAKRKKRKYRRRATATETPVITAKYQGKKISDASMMPILESAKMQKPESTVSYKKDELEKFRVLIIEKINDATDELQSIEERLMDSTSGESGEEDSTYSLHMADQGTDAMEREKAFLFAARERKFISHLSDALQRIKSGNYGVCITCSQLIDKGRLEAVPHARMCVNCKTLGKLP